MNHQPSRPATLPASVALAAEYQRQWMSGTPADLQAFVSRYPELTGEHLLELARVDLIERARAGAARPVESYLQAYPGLGARAEWLLELVDAEICCHQHHGPPPALDDYERRFPEHAAALREIFEINAIDLSSQGHGAADSATDARDGGDSETSRLVAEDTVDKPCPSLGEFEFQEQLGRGGMGVVFKARQVSLNRIVAVKRLLGSATDYDRRRFQAEAEAAARLRHPNIVAIYEVGELDGEPFFAMEYIEGQSLRERIDRGPLPTAEAVALGHAIAEALHYAHQHGVLHRDLKPANVLVDAAGQPHIADFGLAKRLEGGVELTHTGQLLGTPSYMPPEQARGDHAAVGVHSDVYSLGATLYALVTGRPPFAAANVAETLDRVLHDEPARPSHLNPTVDVDLETIILKCLEKEPQKRYATAIALAEDLARYRAGEPIRARRISPPVRAWRWCRRHPWHTVAAALLCVLMIGGPAAGAWIWQGQIAHAQRLRQEEQLRKRADAENVRFQQRDLQWAVRVGDTVAADQADMAIPSGLRSWDSRWLASQRQAAWKLAATLHEGHWGFVDAALVADRNLLLTSDSGGRLLVWNLETGAIAKRLVDGRFHPHARMWLHHYLARQDADVSTWGPLYTALRRVAGTPQVVAASLDGAVARIDTERLELTELFRAKEQWLAIAGSPDGSHILVGSAAGRLCLLDRDGKVVAQPEPPGAAIVELCAFPGEQRWIAARSDGTLDLVEGSDLTLHRLTDLKTPLWSIDVTGDEARTWLAVAGDSPAVRVFEFLPGDRRLRLDETLAVPESAEEVARFQRVRFSFDGQRVQGFDDTGRLWCWSRQSGAVAWNLEATHADSRRAELQKIFEEQKLPTPLPVPLRRIGAAVIDDPAAPRLITAGDDIAVKLWRRGETRTGTRQELPVDLGPRPQVEFDRQQPSRLWVLNAEGWLTLVEVPTGRVVAKHRAHQGGAADLHVLDKPPAILTAGGDAALGVWKADGDKIVPVPSPRFAHDAALISAAASPDGRWFAAVDVNARLLVWNRQTGQVEFPETLAPEEPARDPNTPRRPLTGRVAFSADSQRLCAYGSGPTARLFRVAPFGPIREQVWVAGSGGTAMLWSPVDPKLVLTADDYPRYEARTIDDDALLPTQTGYHPRTPCVALTPTADQRRMVSLEQDGRLVFFETHTLVAVLRLPSGMEQAADLAFDPTGRLLAVANKAGKVELWDAEPQQALAKPPAVDSTAEWQSAWLAEPTSLTLRTVPGMVRVDARGRAQVLHTESEPSDFRNDGALYWAGEEFGPAGRERIEAGDDEFVRRASYESTALEIRPDGQPAIAFRIRTAELSPYDGRMLAGVRRGPKQWQFETIHDHGNLGFYPVLQLGEDGMPQQVVHYSFAGYDLVLSRRTAQDAKWDGQFIGWQGDGLGLKGRWDRQGRMHMVFEPNRINSDPAQTMYACLDGQGFLRDRIDPFQSVANEAPVLTSGGEPVLRVGESLLRRTKDGWVDHARLPIGPGSNIVLDRRDRPGFVTWDAEAKRFLLWQATGERWSVQAIQVPFTHEVPRLWQLFRDAEDRPLIVAWRNEAPFWIAVLRPKP